MLTHDLFTTVRLNKELIEKQAYLNAQLEFGSDSNDDQIVDDNDDDEGESEEMEM